jgi:Spy/CpxP family protein refolding chaperone
MKRKIFSLLFCLLPLIGSPLFAQPDDEDDPGRQRIEEWRKIKLIETLDLTEEQSIKLLTREKDLRQSEKQLMEQRKSALERMRQLVKGNPTEAEIQKEIGVLTQIGKDMVQKRTEYVTGLKDILTPKQIGMLLIFEDNFAKELRRTLQESRRRPGWKNK